jgi:hypothetical protein
VTVFPANTPTMRWKKDLQMDGTLYRSVAKPAIADINKDGKKEILVSAGGGTDTGVLFALTNTGQDLPNWPQNTRSISNTSGFWNGNIDNSSPAIGDIDRDGNLEIMVGTGQGRVMVYPADGSWRGILYGDSIYTDFNHGGTIADINADGYPDMLFGAGQDYYGGGSFFAWDYNGNAITGWPKSYLLSSTPQLVNLDNDSKVEIVFAGKVRGSNQKGIIVVEQSTLTPQTNEWPMYGYNERRTGLFAGSKVGPVPTNTQTPTPTIYIVTPTPVPNVGKALHIPFTNFTPKDYVVVHDPTAQMQVKDSMTVELWTLPEKDIDSSTILSKSGVPYGDRNNTYGLGFINEQFTPNASKPFVLFRTTTGSVTLISPDIVKDDGSTWTHIAFTKSDNTLKLFVNGELKDTKTFTGSIVEFPSSDLSFGAYLNPYDISTSYFGKIDDVRISNISRDITASWTSGLYFSPLQADQYTLGLWRFEDLLLDETRNHLNGEKVGNPTFSNGRVPLPLPTPTITPSPMPTNTPTPLPTATPTNTPMPTPTVKPLRSTIGVFRPAQAAFYLRNSNSSGNADIAYLFGTKTDIPIVGDWNGDGIDTPGIFRNGAFYLRDSNTPGNADIVFEFGQKGDIPIVGDWNGDGKDGVGVFRKGKVFLKNKLSAGTSDISFTYGLAGDLPLAGDWNGDKIDTIGIFRKKIFYLRNTNTSGNADKQVSFSNYDGYPVAGDWDANGTDGIGVYKDGWFTTMNNDLQSPAFVRLNYGTKGDLPLAGTWAK